MLLSALSSPCALDGLHHHGNDALRHCSGCQQVVCPRLSNKEARSLLACAVAALRMFLEEHSLRLRPSTSERSHPKAC